MSSERALYGAMVGLGLLSAEILLSSPGSAAWIALLKSCIAAGATLAVGAVLGRRLAGVRGLPSFLIGLLAGLPIAENLLRIAGGGHARPMELLAVQSLRNLALGLLAVPYGSHAGGASILISLVQVSAMIVLNERGDLPRLVGGIYAVVGGLWLMLGHWRSLEPPEAPAGWGRPPWYAIASLGVAVGSPALVAPSGTIRAPWRLGEWLPSSGGSFASCPEARAGVGQGLDSAGDGQHADSSGFDDGDVFRESDLPSLYDVMTEVYGTPRPPDQIERAIALLPDSIRFRRGLVKSHHHKAGRRFSLLRETPHPSHPSRRVEADALLYVKGPTPLHLRTAVFDRFDGIEWYEVPAAAMPGAVARLDDKRWMGLGGVPTPELTCGTMEHEIRIGLFNSALMPVPLHVERFRVGLVDDPRFFRYGWDGLLRMIRRVPVGTVIETRSRVIRPDVPETTGFAHASTAAADAGGPIHIPPEAAQLARHLTQGLPRGWAQIMAVIQGLQSRCLLDPQAFTADAGGDPTTAFLCDLRRGPGYHFASAAAVMLHALGYRVRLVGGFYVPAGRLDRRSGHTSVQKQDLHFWVEVRTVDGCWLTLDPTPGHRMLTPEPASARRVRNALITAWRGITQSAGGLLLAAVAVAAGLLLRRRLLDGLYTLSWLLVSCRFPQLLPVHTLRLLDRRCRLSGRARPSSVTPSRWYEALTQQLPSACGEALCRTVEAAVWVAFAPEEHLKLLPADEVREACLLTARTLSVKTLRKAFAERSAS